MIQRILCICHLPILISNGWNGQLGTGYLIIGSSTDLVSLPGTIHLKDILKNKLSGVEVVFKGKIAP